MFTKVANYVNMKPYSVFNKMILDPKKWDSEFDPTMPSLPQYDCRNYQENTLQLQKYYDAAYTV